MAAARLLHPVEKIEIRGNHRHHDECSGENASSDGHCSGGQNDADDWVLRIGDFFGHAASQIEAAEFVKSLVPERLHGVESCGEPRGDQSGQRANREGAHADQDDIRGHDLGWDFAELVNRGGKNLDVQCG